MTVHVGRQLATPITAGNFCQNVWLPNHFAAEIYSVFVLFSNDAVRIPVRSVLGNSILIHGRESFGQLLSGSGEGQAGPGVRFGTPVTNLFSKPMRGKLAS